MTRLRLLNLDDFDNIVMLYILDDKHTASEAYLRYSLMCQANLADKGSAVSQACACSSNDCREDAKR